MLLSTEYIVTGLKMGQKMNNNTIALFQSKKSDNWQTPPALYAELNKEFQFDYDPCPLRPEKDGLTTQWGKRCFVNPPYSQVKEFLKKAWKEIELGNTEIAVFLTFSNTDTGWFHEYIYHKAEIRFIKGRLKFLNEDGKTINSAMRPSMLAILRKEGIK